MSDAAPLTNLYFAVRRTREPGKVEQSIVAAAEYGAAQTDPPSELTLIGYAAEGLSGTLIGFTGAPWKCEIRKNRSYAAVPLSVYVTECLANGKRVPTVSVVTDTPNLPETETSKLGYTITRRCIGQALPMTDRWTGMVLRKGEEWK